jgi:uncharacterized protein (DUF1778 family)
MPTAQAISLRISERDRRLIDKAAGAVNKSRTEFLLDSARAAAADALLDRNLFVLTAKEFKAFETALIKAPSSKEVLKELRRRPAPWKK